MTAVVLDACVLYPPSLRDLLMRVAATGACEPHWTDTIHDEWIRNVLRDNPELVPARLERTRALMNQVAPNCLVCGYKKHLPELDLPDADDRHVLAAAIEAQAPLIVTYNLSDFPETNLQAYNVRAVHPDLFLCALFDMEPDRILVSMQAHRASLNNPPKTAGAYIETLRANRLREFALRVHANADSI